MSPEHRLRHRARSSRRPLVLVVLVLVLTALSALSWWSRSTGSVALADLGVSAVAPAGSESSSFTCGGFSTGASSAIPGSVVLTSSVDSPRTATVTVVDDAGHAKPVTVSVPADHSIEVPVSAQAQGGSVLGALVLVAGGGVGVTERVTLAGEGSTTACASSTSPAWYFAGGSTAAYHQLSYVVVNPTATLAIVNASFETSAGQIAAPAAQGIVVPAFGVASISVADSAPHLDWSAGEVTATKGSVVAFETLASPDPKGVAVVLGQPALANTLTLGRGVASPGTTVSVVISNPTASAQLVSVRAQIPSGILAPWTQAVAPFSSWVLTISPSSRIPLTDPFSLAISADGPGVAAQLWTLAAKATAGGVGPVPAVTAGPASAGRWLLPASSPIGLSLVSLSPVPVVLHVTILTAKGPRAVAGLDGSTVAAGRALFVPESVLAGIGGHPVVIQADGALVVTEDMAGGAAPGTATLNALPLRS